jgi:hypothetical protein
MNQANKDFVKMKRYQYVSAMTGGGPRTIVVDITSGKTMSVKDFTRLSNEQAVSKNEMVGYKKVKSEDGVPLTIQRKSGKSLDEFSVFKMVNLYGSSRIVAEYPKLMTPSALDNNTFKVEEELTDNAIIAIFAGEVVPNTSVISDEQSLASEVLEEATEITMQMQPANIEKIKAGTKTTTTRSESQSKQINIPVGESAIVNFGGQDFKVTNRGQLTIEEAGGKEAMLKSEGVQSEKEFMYQQTKDWVNGKGKLYVYDIVSTEVPTSAEPIVEDITPEQPLRTIKVNQFSITIQPDGKMFFDNGKEVTDQTIKNKVNIRKELQDGTLRVSTYNNSEYFVLLDGRILGSGKTNLGKETVTDPKIKEQILDKAVLYRKTC